VFIPTVVFQLTFTVHTRRSDLNVLVKLDKHRITEWFGLEGTLQIIWFQLPCHGQGHLPLDQVARSPIQPGLEHLQGGDNKKTIYHVNETLKKNTPQNTTKHQISVFSKRRCTILAIHV